MYLVDLFEMQQSLNKKIREKQGIPADKKLTHLTIDALDVEIAELQNETRYFKYWSQDQKPRMKKLLAPATCEEDKEYYNPCLEEYADALHMLLTIGIDYEIPFEFEILPHHYNDLRRQFRALKRHIYTMNGSMDWYLTMNLFFGLAEMLGFTEDMIREAYIRKNEINHRRQEEGY